ncbi:KAP family P-loop domain-containing protein [Paenibacillus sp. CF095]|uniref:P-loop NTPase fold protein n=1 Tax=Paenibacillus sp. CF095 TaxID=1881033 RepID=UPI000886CE5A|nr:P-loop NTPase fold protein [Paenibacillus sp. CF095]SDD54676.1 KAP family P-loop domain-containing protein [Paenibacillus sp. CF095]
MDDLEKAINDYLKTKETTYALLIDGRWGSGKTYFIQNKLMRRIEVIEHKPLHDEGIRNGQSMYKPVYVSLFGLESISDLEKEIFLAINPSVKENQEKLIIGKQLGRIALNVSSAFGFRVGNTDISLQPFIKAWTDNLDTEVVLFFDDIERCRINYVELFGFLNKLIEQDGIKTLLIADEEQILCGTDSSKETVQTPVTANVQDYKRFKEKIVGKTFIFSPNEKVSITSIIEKYRLHKKYYAFLNKKTKLVVEVFRDTETKNLRSLSQALSDFLIIFEKLDKMSLQDIDNVAEKLLKYTIAFTAEIKTGKFANDELSGLRKIEIRGQYYSSSRRKKMLLDAEKLNFTDYFMTKYYNGTTNVLMKLTSITDFLITGYLDEDELKKETSLYNISEKTVEVLLYEKFYEMEQVEFNNSIESTLSRIEEGLLSVNLFEQFYTHFLMFIEQGLITKSVIEIQNVFQKGIVSYFSSKNVRDGDILKINKNEITDFHHFLREKIFEFEQLQNKNQWKKDIKSATSTVASNPDNLINLLGGRIQTIKFFEYLSPIDFVNAISKINRNKNIIKLRNAIKDRSDLINTGKHREDYKIYEQLTVELQKVINNQSVEPLRKYNLNILNETFREIEHELRTRN